MDESKGFSFEDYQVRHLWPKVYRFIYHRVQNREEAEDITQETFRRVYPKLTDGGIGENKIEAYTISAAKNLINEEWRRRMRRPAEVSADEMKSSGWEPASTENECREDTIVVQHALNNLQSDHKKVLTLRIIEGYSVIETAKIMKRNSGAVRSLQLRAVRALKRELEKGGYFNE